MEKKFTAATLIGSLLVAAFTGAGAGVITTKSVLSGVTPAVDGGGAAQDVLQEVVEEQSAMINSIEQVQPAVVSVVATKDLQIIRQNPFDGFFGNPFIVPQQQAPDAAEPETVRQQVSGGTGFFIQEDGLLITNRHVVQDETADFTVVTNDGQEFFAEVVSRDPANDIAFVQAYTDEERTEKPSGIPVAEFGSSDDLQVGQHVIAIGNALGEFQNSVTSGIVSAKERRIQASDPSGRNAATLNNLLQTDAAINSGNSGGPLIDLSGRVIGVNTAVANGAEGIGFAIPIDDVKPVLASLEKYGEIKRAQLGARYMILTPAAAAERGLAVEEGALLVGEEQEGFFAVVPGSPADEAGLQLADVILSVNGEPITTTYTLSDAISSHFPGDVVQLEIWRGGETFNVDVTLTEL